MSSRQTDDGFTMAVCFCLFCSVFGMDGMVCMDPETEMETEMERGGNGVGWG